MTAQKPQRELLTETDIMHDIMIKVSQHGARVFRNNSGTAWAGTAHKYTSRETVTVNPGDVVVRQARPLHAGLTKSGSADLIGIVPVTIRPDHVGQRIGVFASIEVKRAKGGVISDDQTNFRDQITALGGLAGICRDAQDALAIISRLNATP